MDSSTTTSIERQPAKKWRIVLGILLLLVLAGNSVNRKPTDDLPSVLGQLTGMLILVILATWLISSGLPRSIGHPDLKRTRRQIWCKLAWYGFLVMLNSALLTLWLGWGNINLLTVIIILMSWIYWFGWTWIAWLIADKKAVRKISLQIKETIKETSYGL